jgi:hypothetical protein
MESNTAGFQSGIDTLFRETAVKEQWAEHWPTRALVRDALNAGLGDQADDVSVLIRVQALARLAEWEPATLALKARKPVRPALCPPVEPGLLRYYEWALGLWATVTGSDTRALSAPLRPSIDALAPCWPGSKTRAPDWTAAVDHPLDRLRESLDAGQVVPAYLYLRDVLEGVLRVAWAVLVHETCEWCVSDQGHALARTERACQEVLASATRGAFTIGSAAYLLTGDRDRTPIRELAPQLAKATLVRTQALDSALDGAGVRGAIQRLHQWRNADVGHGLVGSERRLAALFEAPTDRVQGDARPVLDLATLLGGLGPWLAETAEWLRKEGWPSLHEARLPARAGGQLQGAPSPIAFVRGGAALWLLEQARDQRVVARDVLGGVRSTHSWATPHKALTALIANAKDSLRPLDLTSDQIEAAQAHDQMLRRERAVLTPLVGMLSELVARTRGVVHVVGSAGSGKSVLLGQLADSLSSASLATTSTGRRVVAHYAAVAGIAFNWSNLARGISETLRVRGVRWPDDERGGHLDQLPPDPAEAIGWWKGLIDRNPADTYVLIVDGLDEMHSYRGESISGLPFGIARETDRVRVVLGYRSARELEPGVARELPPAAATLDLDAFYRTEEGRTTLLAYVKEKHKGLKGLLGGKVEVGGRRVAFGDALIEEAGHTFLTVFHLARGLEAGFLQADAVKGWPSGEELYSRYLAWIEGQAAHHPGYVRSLRRILLVLARAPVPVNDPTLLFLLGHGAHGDLDPSPEDTSLAWLFPVLADLSDFLDRRRASIEGGAAPDSALERAALIVAPDAKARPSDGMVRTIAHATLRSWLLSERLAGEWRTERSAIDTEMNTRMTEGIEVWKADPTQTGATVRYVQQCLWANLLPGTQAFETAFAVWTKLAPEDIRAWPASRHWVEALRAAWACLQERDPVEEESRRRSLVLGRLGSALAQAQQTAEAVALHRQEVALNRALCGLAEGASDEEVRGRVRDQAGAVRELSIGLERLGSALTDAQQTAEAVTMHRQAVALLRAQ